MASPGISIASQFVDRAAQWCMSRIAQRPPRGRALAQGSFAAIAMALLAGCGGGAGSAADDQAALVSQGKQIFRFDTFGDESLWSDTLRMHEVIAAAVDPTTALSVGLKVDAEALPPASSREFRTAASISRIPRPPWRF